MKGFQTIERRISANDDKTRFRVQFKTKDGRANAKILKTIAEARKLRDKTDSASARKLNTKGKYLKQTPAEKISIHELDFSPKGDVDSSQKLKLLDRYLNILEKILAV